VIDRLSQQSRRWHIESIRKSQKETGVASRADPNSRTDVITDTTDKPGRAQRLRVRTFLRHRIAKERQRKTRRYCCRQCCKLIREARHRNFAFKAIEPGKDGCEAVARTLREALAIHDVTPTHAVWYGRGGYFGTLIRVPDFLSCRALLAALCSGTIPFETTDKVKLNWSRLVRSRTQNLCR